MNISASLNVFRLITNPSLCLPHATIPTFNQLPVPISKAFPASEKGHRPDIRAIVLDKDNCFARPKENVVYEVYHDKFQALKAAYPHSRLLIVSNSAGTNSDPGHADAALLERNTGIPVLRHSTKKPGCGHEILSYFRNIPEAGVTEPGQITIVGDRLFTDVLMANMMGSWSVWVRDGVVEEKGLFTAMEKRLAGYLLKKGYSPPTPSSQFEG
ncbi:hypothetical protein MMC34_000192 [Xylographa carneopallida]|nr:hypothetical protein [Xylographa carneopallida]